MVSTHAEVPISDEVTEALAKKNAKGEIDYVQMKQEWLTEIVNLIDDGNIKAIISKVFPLEKVAEAHREIETKHVRGKLILEVRNL